MKRRSKKRPHPMSLTEKFLKDYFPNEIGESRKYFLRTEPESSCVEPTGNAHIIYYQPFLKHHFVIRNIPRNVATPPSYFDIHIKPVDWARSFNQRDLVSTTKQLIKAIMNENCLKSIIGEKIAIINAVKIVQRTAVWMMSKFNDGSHIDLWSYPLNYKEIEDRLPPPSESDNKIIMDTISCNDPRYEFLAELVTELDQRLDFIVDSGNILNLGELLANQLDDVPEDIREETKYEEMFNRCVDCVRNSPDSGEEGNMNTAQIMAALTRSTIPNNEDQFVDAVQISPSRWKAAFKADSIAKVAAKLATNIIRRDFANDIDGFRNAQDLCPVKLSAIYRAAKFLDTRKDVKKFYEVVFDSRISSHNLFPTVEECIAIDNELRLHGVCTVLGRLRLQNDETTNDYLDSVAASMSVDLLASLPSTLASPQVMNVGAIQEGPIQTVQNDPISNPVQQASTSSSNVRYYYVPLEAPVLSYQGEGHVEANHLFADENPFDRENLQQLNRNGIIKGIEPILLKPEFTEPTYILLTIKTKNNTINGPQLVTLYSHAFSKGTWMEAKMLYAEKGATVVGKKLLLQRLFETDELRDATPSGKPVRNPRPGQEKQQLDVNRQQQLLDAIQYFIGNVKVSNSALNKGPWSASVEKEMIIDVIRQGTKEIRADLNKVG